MLSKFPVNVYGFSQNEYCRKNKEIFKTFFKTENPTAYIKTYGCQQNVSDSEKYEGILREMGFDICENYESANVILLNTCAVRENAENKVFGNVGKLKSVKKERPETIIILCGCMTQQENILEKIKSTYTFVDLVFGTHSFHDFPKLLYNVITAKKNSKFYIKNSEDSVFENTPTYRKNKIKAFVSIMSGCNNFCSYCVVPYVRGRERSRSEEAVIHEFKNLLEAGYKDITLLGQNVNSYGKDLTGGESFSRLLKKLDNFEKEYTIRFMTSHPKDITEELIDTIASGKHISHHIHLPVQCGSDEILKKMNRKYTVKDYLKTVDYAKNKIKDVTFGSDIIVGFPGENYEDFLKTLSLIKTVKFSSLFTFIYSPRKGTPAALLTDNISKEEKTKWLMELIENQEIISENLCKSKVGTREKVLAENYDFKSGFQICKNSSGTVVKVKSEQDLSGGFINVEIIDSSRESLTGKLI